MKRFLVPLILFLAIQVSQSQDLLSSAININGVISLGEKAVIQCNINQETVCDSYTIESEVNYYLKTITFVINYNYNSICNESFSVFTEFPEAQVILEGVYFVSVKLNVPNNFTWNKTIQLGSTLVLKPTNINCEDSSIPFITGNCPLIGPKVCACNGITYDNECFAYLKELNGKYYDFNCAQYIELEARNFECQNLYINQKNVFENYSCDANLYAGKEIYLHYNHVNFGDSLIIEYTTQANNTKMFLIKLENGNIQCIAKSVDKKLVMTNISSGNYYLIVDRLNTGNYNVEFCVTTSNNEIKIDNNFQIFPNPSSSMFYMDFKVDGRKTINIYNNLGKKVFTKSVDGKNTVIHHNLTKGIYYISLLKESNNLNSGQKLLIE